MNIQAIQSQERKAASSASTSAAQGNSGFSSYLNTSNTLDEIFSEASVTYDVPKDLLKAIAKAESGFNPNATSKSGAQGIMQLMPATAKYLGVTDAYDPYQNIMGGAKFISQMLDQFNGNVSLALAAYNAGPNNVTKYGGIPPFEQTQNYVAKVTGYMQANISVPNASYAVPGTHADSYYENILDELFSYEDYIEFLDLYMEVQDAQKEKEEQEEQEEGKSDSYFSYQEIKYNPAILNILNGK